MAQGRDRKILRIGIIQNGKIIEERLLRRRESVTVGQSSRNTFVLPLVGVPKSFTVFELRGGVYHLNFRPEMSGKVSVDSSVLGFDALRSQNLATRRGDVFSLALSEKSRGKVVVDDLTLLFQFVQPPPPARLQLPASVRGSIWRGLDWPYVSSLLGSAVVQIFGLLFVTMQDYPEKPKSIADLPDRFVQAVFKKKDVPVPKPKVNDTAKDDTKEGDEPKEKVAEKAPPKPVKRTVVPKVAPEALTTEQKARRDAKRKAAMAAKVRSKTILSQLGSKGGDGPGTIVDSLVGGATDVSMKDAFDGASGVMLADSAGAARDTRRRVGGGTGKVAGIDKDAVRAKGGGRVASGKKGSEVKVKGTLKVKRPSEAFGTGVLDSAEIAKVVRRRKGAVKNCYERQLKRNPKLAGTVKIQFTIQQSGRIGQATVLQNTTGDSGLGTCIVSQIKRWRFRKPDGGSVTVAYPFVFAPSN
jgi:TonB family protein